MKSRKTSEKAPYPNPVGFAGVMNDGELGWALTFFDNGDITMGFCRRNTDGLVQAASPEEFKHKFPTDPASYTVPVSAEAVEWIRGEIEQVMSRQHEHTGPWLGSALEDIRHTLTLTIDEKRRGDPGFFGDIPWPKNRPAQGPEAMVHADIARLIAEELRDLAQKYNNAAMMTFKRNDTATVVIESDYDADAPLQQALETRLDDGWSPVGILAVEYIGDTAHGETMAIHQVACTGSGLEPKVQAQVLREISQALIAKLNEKPAPTWFRTGKTAMRNESGKEG